MQKAALKTTKYSRNDTIFKMDHHANAIAFEKSSMWFKYWNSKNHVKIHSKNNLELSCAKSRSKKHEVIQKWDHIQNGPSCKGYSLWKIFTMAQKLKLQKTCQNPFYKSFRVVLWNKTAKKTRNIPEMRQFPNSAIMQRL